MNKKKIYYQRRNLLDQVRYSSLSGNREGCFRSYASETKNHIRKKFEAWLRLKKQGYQVWTEIIFKSGIRMDILAFKDGRFICIEILENETREE